MNRIISLSRTACAALAVFAALSGCATQGSNTQRYDVGTKPKITNEVTIDSTYSVVWDKLVRDLSKSYYVINNIDKESRIINVSFSSTEPAEFVDCGRTTRTFTEGSSVERFDYDVAGKSKFKVATDRQAHPSFSSYAVVTRDPILDGRANIYLAPSTSNSNSTTLSVNSRYILNVRAKGQVFLKHAGGNVIPGERIPEEILTFAFNTNESSSKDAGRGVSVTCFSNGKLESEIIGLVKSK